MAEDTITFPIYDSMLDTIRVRPAMYLGEISLTALYHFMLGYEMAVHRFGPKEKPPELPRHFADWVGYRLHLDSNHSGFWHRAILSRVTDEHQALLRFYELRDEYLHREERVVATIRKDRREYKAGIYSNGKTADHFEELPKSLRIVVYTEDPGFFLVADDSEQFFYSGWFFPSFSNWIFFHGFENRFEIHEQRTWDRLLAENKKYNKNLAQRRARLQKKVQQD